MKTLIWDFYEQSVFLRLCVQNLGCLYRSVIDSFAFLYWTS